MRPQRCSAESPVAILSFHSHSDRSFLDDRELALLSGALRDDGIANDLVLTVLTREMEADERGGDVERRLLEVLQSYDPILYERVWSPRVIERLRAGLPGKVFVGLRGEHLLLENSPADIFCNGELSRVVAPLIRWLRGEVPKPPAGTLFRHTPASEAGEWVQPEEAQEAPERPHRYAPNLRPVVVNPESLPANRTFSLVGNPGCPFQADARKNPIYEGVEIPERYGRGCAFCTTGNHYEGRPNEETAAFVLEQIRHVRATAPELDRLVLKDQNPFGYLTEVVERCEAEGLTGFTILLETRADWMMRSRRRFDRALAAARRGGLRLAPFLVGIENFSQRELDRFNKGTTAEANLEFIEALWSWKEEYGEALDLGHTAFGFILFSPWTTLEDLEINLAAIRRTRFDRLRGSVLLSRARLYPDTALYYLAQRDGLLVEEFRSEAENASRRYGYYPSHPWRHVHADVAHFAAIATELAERNQSRDMVGLFASLLATFRSAGAGWPEVTVESAWAEYERSSRGGADSRRADVETAPVPERFRARFERLVRPLRLQEPFAGGWRLDELRAQPGRVAVALCHADEPSLAVEIVPRGDGPAFGHSRHYDIRALGRDFTPGQERALEILTAAIARNDV